MIGMQQPVEQKVPAGQVSLPIASTLQGSLSSQEGSSQPGGSSLWPKQSSQSSGIQTLSHWSFLVQVWQVSMVCEEHLGSPRKMS
jgi:hypothetical protein